MLEEGTTIKRKERSYLKSYFERSHFEEQMIELRECFIQFLLKSFSMPQKYFLLIDLYI